MSNNCVFLPNSVGIVQPLNDPYWSKVSLLTHLNGQDGSTTFIDEKGNALPKSGSPVLSNGQSVFGGSSLYCGNGAGSLHLNGTSSAFNFGTGDFTLEAWIYPTANKDSGIMSNTYNAASTNINVTLLSTGKIRLSSYTAVIGDGSSIINLNEWTHVAVSRSGNTIYLWVNGQLDRTFNYSSTFSDNYFTIGFANKGDNAGGYTFNGYIDEVRVTKGVARYTAPFAVPNAPFPNA